jgi:uncharacterized protein (DUF433 family)
MTVWRFGPLLADFRWVASYNEIAMSMPTTSSLDPARYISSDPDRLGGEPVFKGTRVPIRSLFNYLRKGMPLEKAGLSEFENRFDLLRRNPLKIAEGPKALHFVHADGRTETILPPGI